MILLTNTKNIFLYFIEGKYEQMVLIESQTHVD